MYYKELTKLYGKTGFYAIDPFHEGGSTQGVNLDAAGKSHHESHEKTNPDAVAGDSGMAGQSSSPMIEHLEAGDLLVLDLHSEYRRNGGTRRQSGVVKEDGQHEWVYCMLLNLW